jgi:hypothetical protein
MTLDEGRARSGRRVGAAARGALAALLASATLVAALTLAARVAGAQDTTLTRSPLPTRPDARPLEPLGKPLRISDIGPGVSGRMLRAILAAPHLALRGDSIGAVALRRDTTFGTTLVVVGGDASVAGHVRGDLVVIGGDIYVRPGARVDGRAIAYGGGIYPSALGIVRGGAFSYRDHTFVPTEGATEVALAYRDLEGYPVPWIAFPLAGLQIPEYTRVDGLALGWGPTITIAEGGTEIVPTLTYRTHLGAIDPRVEAAVRFDRRTRLLADVGRGTFSNDRWIRGNIVNSITTFIAGNDTRNYFRADRADVRVERAFESQTTTLTPFAGGRVETAWSTGPDSLTTSAPFTILGRDDRERILRPNPRVRRGGIASALAGARLEWESPQLVTVSSGLQVEQAFRAPAGGDAFTQVTGHMELGFPTYGTQSFEMTTHAVFTAGDAPPQRWAYLGGPGTLLTLDLLELGGDQLVYVESRYNIPVNRLAIPFAGPPLVTLRHGIGSAGAGSLPTWVQNVGIRVTIAVLRFDYTIDPSTRDSKADISFAMPF